MIKLKSWIQKQLYFEYMFIFINKVALHSPTSTDLNDNKAKCP